MSSEEEEEYDEEVEDCELVQIEIEGVLQTCVIPKRMFSNNEKPTEIYNEPYVHRFNVENLKKYYPGVRNESGKWLMFIENSKFDEKWEEVCKIFDSGVLTGIFELKCTTSYISPRASDLFHGVILFYCGPASDEEKIMEYGKNILKWIKYESTNGYMAYKTDEQTRTGTRSLGQKINCIYRIPVPRATSTIGTNKKPSKIYDVPDVYHFKAEIQIKYSDVKDEEAGKWLMFIEKSKLDKKWEEVCKMYDSGVLTGIYQVQCSTSFKHHGATDLSQGVIRFYCGPASDEKKVMEYGQNILKWIKYENTNGFMYYKTNKLTKALGQTRTSAYRIPVPGRTVSANFSKRTNKWSIQRIQKSFDNESDNSCTYDSYDYDDFYVCDYDYFYDFHYNYDWDYDDFYDIYDDYDCEYDYKINKQSKAGTRALDRKRNSTYRISVPGRTVSANFYKKRNKLSAHRTRKSFDIDIDYSYTDDYYDDL